MDDYIDSRKIQREFTAPYTPQQNGKADRGNRMLIESARTMLLAKYLPKYLWVEACSGGIPDEQSWSIKRTKWSDSVLVMDRCETESGAPEDIRIGSLCQRAEVTRDEIRGASTEDDIIRLRQQLIKLSRFDPILKKVKISRDVIFCKTAKKTALQSDKSSLEELFPPKKEKNANPV